MTIEKYLQDKVDINEITERDKDFILSKLNEANVSKIGKWILCYFLLYNYIYDISFEISEIDLFKEMLKLKLADLYIATFSNELKDLVKKGFLRNINTEYSLPYKDLKKNIKDSNCEYDCKNCQSEEDIKKTAIIRAENIFMIYNNYHGEAINQIGESLKSVFGFEITNNDNLLSFEMGGCGYNLYLSRGYIVFEAEDNSTIDNVYTLDNVAELIDLIKDLSEDN